MMAADDAGDGVVAARQGELVLEALGAEAGLAAEFDDRAFQAAGDLMGAAVGATTVLGQRGGFTGLMATEPLADRIAGTAKLPHGGLDAVGTGEGDELLVEKVAVGVHAIELKVGAVHPPKMAQRRPGRFGPLRRRPRVPLASIGGGLTS